MGPTRLWGGVPRGGTRTIFVAVQRFQGVAWRYTAPGQPAGHSGRRRVGHFQRRFARVAVRSVTAAAVSLAVLGAVTSAQASVVFDFVDMADMNEEEFDNSALYATVDGIKVQAFASNNFMVAKTSVPYLDDRSGGEDGGLGVCSSGLNGPSELKPGQCSIPSDDNVSGVSTTEGETLTLKFFDSATMDPITVTLDLILFRDANHDTNFGSGMFNLDDGGGFMTLALMASFTPSTPLTNHIFDFKFYDTQF